MITVVIFISSFLFFSFLFFSFLFFSFLFFSSGCGLILVKDMRMNNCEKLAAEVPGVDIILCGHDHFYEGTAFLPLCNFIKIPSSPSLFIFADLFSFCFSNFLKISK